MAERSSLQASVADSAGPVRATLVLVIACSAEFMVVLDASVVNVALPAIRAGLGFDAVGLQWVVTSYALVLAGFLLLGGRLADLYGRRQVFLGGLTLFTVASAVGGLAPTPATLIVARAAQALGAAVLAPASLTILTTTFVTGAGRTRALSIWTGLGAAAGAAGSLIGGVLTEYLSWRATLLINLPIGVAVAVLTLRALPSDQPTGSGARRATSLDVRGAFSATLGLVALTYGVSTAPEYGWSAGRTLVAFVVAAVALAVFMLQETRWASSPLMPLRLFTHRAFTIGNLAMLLNRACLMPMWFLLSLYMQQVLDLSAVQTGLGFLPHTVLTVVVGAQLAPKLVGRVPPHALLTAGSALAAGGFFWQSRLDLTDTYLTSVLGPAVVLSIGIGLVNTSLTLIVTTSVSESDAGAASGLFNTTKQVGGALGVAALLTLFTSSAGNTSDHAAADPAAQLDGFSVAFLAMAAVMLIVATLAAFSRQPAPSH